MRSHRCGRCWIYLNTKRRLADHQRDNDCVQVEMPANERFMDLELEAEVRASHGALDDDASEELWWDLFRLLIPGMRQIDVAQLKQEYYPCQPSPFPTGAQLARACPVLSDFWQTSCTSTHP